MINNNIDTNLIDCLVQLKKYRHLLNDAEFEERVKDYNFCLAQVNYFDLLLKKGIEYIPKF